MFEPLEPRQLLTTVYGGDVLEFIDFDGNIQQIRLLGNVMAELIAADAAGQLGDLEGDFLEGPRVGQTAEGIGPGQSLFAIYVSHSEEGASIVLTGEGGPVLDGVGSVLLGGTAGEGLFFTQALLTDQIGLRAVGTDEITDPNTNTSSGITLPETLLQFASTKPTLAERLLGENVNKITAMAFDSQGRLWAIDGDDAPGSGFDPGAFAVGSQLVQIDPATGKAISTATIVDESGNELRDFTAIAAIGDTLYAVQTYAQTIVLAEAEGNDDFAAADSNPLLQVEPGTISRVPGSITVTGDVDVFRFDILDAQRVDVELGATFQQSPRYVLNPSGTADIAIQTGIAGGTNLNSLNQGAGVKLGDVDITTRNGLEFTVDLSAAATVADVIAQISAQTGNVVTAEVGENGSSLVLTDLSVAVPPAELGSLTVVKSDTADDLGLTGTTTTKTLQGTSIFAYYPVNFKDIDADGTEEGVATDVARTIADLALAVTNWSGGAATLLDNNDGTISIRDNTFNLDNAENLSVFEVQGGAVALNLGILKQDIDPTDGQIVGDPILFDRSVFDGNVAIYDDAGDLIQGDAVAASGQRITADRLQPGTYYAVVRTTNGAPDPFDPAVTGSGTGDYTLSIGLAVAYIGEIVPGADIAPFENRVLVSAGEYGDVVGLTTDGAELVGLASPADGTPTRLVAIDPGTGAVTPRGNAAVDNATPLDTLRNGRGIDIAEGVDFEIRTSGLTSQTLLDYLNGGDGVPTVSGPEFEIQKADGHRFEIDLDDIDGAGTSATEIGQLFEAIEYWEFMSYVNLDVPGRNEISLSLIRGDTLPLLEHQEAPDADPQGLHNELGLNVGDTRQASGQMASDPADIDVFSFSAGAEQRVLLTLDTTEIGLAAYGPNDVLIGVGQALGGQTVLEISTRQSGVHRIIVTRGAIQQVFPADIPGVNPGPLPDQNYILTAELAADPRQIILEDTSQNPSGINYSFAVRSINNSGTAEALGIDQIVNPAVTRFIIGDNLLLPIAVDLADIDGLGTRATTVGDVIAGIERKATGSKERLLDVAVSPDGTGLTVTDRTYKEPTTIPLAIDEVNSRAARDLGLLQTSGVRAIEGQRLVADPGSIEYGPDGILFAQDLFFGELVDVEVPQGGRLVFGTRVRTGLGSLRPTVGSMALSSQLERMYVVDNGTSRHDTLGYNEEETSALMQVRGVGPDAVLPQEVPQNMTSLLVDGTVTGRVDLSGGLETFFSSILATGTITGQLIAAPEDPGNFRVGGDLRNLVVSGDIGGLVGASTVRTQPDLFYGTDIVVGGRIGQVYATQGSFGRIQALNEPDAPRLRNTWSELDIRPGEGSELDAWNNGRLARRHELFGSPQYIGSTLDGLTTVEGALLPPTEVEDLPDQNETEPNDTRLSADPLGLISNTRVQMTGIIGSRLDIDMYWLRAKAGESVVARLVVPGESELVGSVAIYDAAGGLLAYNSTAATAQRGASASIIAQADDVYYVVVRSVATPAGYEPPTPPETVEDGVSDGGYVLTAELYAGLVNYPDYFAAPLMAGEAMAVQLNQQAQQRWVSYAGGSALDQVNATVVGMDGYVYAVGTTASPNWAQMGRLNGAPSSTSSTANDAFVAKYNRTGNLLWSSYLGGTGDEEGLGIAVDARGSVYVTGSTTANGWASGGFDPSFNGGGSDGFVAKLSTDGQVLWSSYFGGDADDAGRGIAVDSSGNIFIAGQTQSTAWTSGVTSTVGTYQSGDDAFVLRIGADSTRRLTYSGGAGDDQFSAIAIDAGDRVFVAGTTSVNGNPDGLIARMNDNGSLAWTQQIGGTDVDVADALVVDPRGYLYLAGTTASSGWVDGGLDTSFGGMTDGFVAKFGIDGGDVLWSSYIGGSEDDSARGVTVDTFGNVYVVGASKSINWTSVGFQNTLRGESDGFIAKFDQYGQFGKSSYVGGAGTESATGVAIDRRNRLYVSGQTGSAGWAADGYDTTYGGEKDGFLAAIDEAGWLAVGVFDPDQRLVATNYSNVDRFASLEAPVQFTADRPGVYRIAVALRGDADFVREGEFESGTTFVQSGPDDLEFDFGGALDPLDQPRGPIVYQLHISGLGDLALGAVVAEQGDILTTDGGIRAVRGDVGAVIAGSAEPDLNGQLGAGGDTNYLLSVGSRFQPDIVADSGNLRAVVARSIGYGEATDIGDDFRMVFGPTLGVEEGSIGLIRAYGNDGLHSLYFNPDPDVAPVGGDIQLIDAAWHLHGHIRANDNIGVIRVRGDFGASNEASSVEINADGVGRGSLDLIDVTGNFGYPQSGGPQLVGNIGSDFRYILVDGTIYQDRAFGSGVAADVTHAVGASVTFRDDSGGEMLVNPVSYRPFDPPQFDDGGNELHQPGQLTTVSYGVRNTGGTVLMRVTSTEGVGVRGFNAFGGQSNGQISQINVLAEGPAILPPTLTEPWRLDPEGVPVDVSIEGAVPIDVFRVSGTALSQVANLTGGEIANISADSVGYIVSRGSLGLAQNHTSAAVNPILPLPDAYPFVDDRIGLVVTGDVLRATAGGAIGNIIVDGFIAEVRANSDGTRISSTGPWEGIAGNIVAGVDLGVVEIGHGIAPTGSGAMSHAGIYVQGQIASVLGATAGADIRGDIVATAGIGQISLDGGYIINADIISSDLLTNGREFAKFLPTFDDRDTIGDIRAGGIIGSSILATTIGNITVTGFGIINSRFQTAGSAGSIGSVNAAGVGIRGTVFDASGSMGSVTLPMTSNTLDIRSYSQSVRVSEAQGSNDPFFNQPPSRLTDLHVYLGTSIDDSAISGVTTGGAIRDAVFRGVGSLQQVRATDIARTRFDFASSIGGITTLADLRGVSVTTGRLDAFRPGGSVLGSDITVAGRIGSIKIRGSMANNSSIIAAGPNALLRDVTIAGNFSGLIRSTSAIKSIVIRGDFEGEIAIEGQRASTVALNKLEVRGNVKEFNLLVDGDVATIKVGGDLGTEGSQLALNSVRSLTVGGQINAEVLVRGDLQSLRSGGDIAKNIYVTGQLGTFAVQNGDVSGDIYAGESIGTMTVTGGDFSGNVTVAIGGVRGVTISEGDATGDWIVAGPVETFNIRRGGFAGNLSAAAVRTLGVDGTFSGDIDLVGDLTSARIGGDVAQGATLYAGSIGTLAVTGDLRGVVVSDREVQSITSGEMNGAMILAGGSINRIQTGDIRDSLLQAGVERGGDGEFASGRSVMAGIQSLAAAGITDSIIAASADLLGVNTRSGVADSVLLSGFALSRGAIDQFLAGSLSLTDRAQLLGGADRELFRGNIDRMTVGGTGLTGCIVAAGIDPGADGDFTAQADNSILSSPTGGQSSINSIHAAMDATSWLFTDSGLRSASLTGSGAANHQQLDYTLADLLTANPANPADLVSTAVQGSPITVTSSNGQTLRVTVTGPGSIDIYDDAGTADRVDLLVLRGGTAATRVDLATSSTSLLGIGRLVSEDDAAVGSLTFNGNILGDDTDDVDFLVDGGAGTVSLNGLNATAVGRLGGNLTSLTVVKLDGELRVGDLRSLAAGGSGSLHAGQIGTMAVPDGSAVAVQADGAVANITAGPTFTGSVVSSMDIVSFRQTGALGGTIQGVNIKSVTISGSVDSAGRVVANGSLGSVTVSGSVAGEVRGGSMGSLKASAVSSTATIASDGDIKSVAVTEAFGGSLVARGGLLASSIGSMSAASIIVGGDATNLRVAGECANSLVAAGVWVGLDGLFNTNDDLILGGNILNARFGGLFRNTALTAGVLPGQAGMPAEFNAYSPGSGGNGIIDRTEAGGLRSSRIDNVILNEVVSTNTGKRASILAAADTMGRVSQRSGIAITKQTYPDPSDAPRVVSVTPMKNFTGVTTEFRVRLSEQINTDSVVLGATLHVVDQNGTDLSVSWRVVEYQTDTGGMASELRITRPAGFTSGKITLKGDPSGLTIFDRSGGRSMLRSWGQQFDSGEKAFGLGSSSADRFDMFGSILNETGADRDFVYEF